MCQKGQRQVTGTLRIELSREYLTEILSTSDRRVLRHMHHHIETSIEAVVFRGPLSLTDGPCNNVAKRKGQKAFIVSDLQSS